METVITKIIVTVISKPKQRNDQGRNKRNDAAHNNQAGPRIDFKARQQP